MRSSILSAAHFLVLAPAVAALALGCRVQTNDVAANFDTDCPEFSQGDDVIAASAIDVKVRAFVMASADLRVLGNGIRGDVKAACINICKDLGETDRWSTDDSDAAIANGDKTGACDVASAKIEAIMTAGATLSANFALEVTGGQCQIATEVQQKCEETCKTDVTCTEATIEKRCDPAQLVVQCDAECKAEATCEGTVDVSANCMGKCESECVGSCNGQCNGTTTGGCDGSCKGKCDGAKTGAGGQPACAGTCEGSCSQCKSGANCQGKCEATCNGKCKGECKLDVAAHVNCGARVSCRGGCTGAFTAPQCSTELIAPVCTGDTTCQTSCSAQGSAKATCNPATVTLIADLEASADLAKLKATVETNLPTLLLAANTRGQLASRALGKVSASGKAAIDTTLRLNTKTIACAAKAASVSQTVSASVDVAVKASASVSASCAGKAG